MRTCLLILLVAATLVAPASASRKKPTLYQRLGGFYGVAALVDDFVDRLLSDPVIAANPRVVEAFDRGEFNVPGLKAHLTNLLCHLAGGPEEYTGRSMEEAHEGLAITPAEWDAAVADLQAAMADRDLPEDVRRDLLALVAPTRDSVVGR